MDTPLKSKPIVHEVFKENGEHSHYELLDADTAKVLWLELDELNDYEYTEQELMNFFGIGGCSTIQ